MALATKETLQSANRVLPDSSALTLITPKIDLPTAGIPMSTGGGCQIPNCGPRDRATDPRHSCLDGTGLARGRTASQVGQLLPRSPPT